MGWELVLLSSLAPVAMDAIKNIASGVSRKVGGMSVDEQVKLEDANVARLTALATLDAPVGTPSQWVVDLRASFRYISAIGLILAGIGVAVSGVAQKNMETVNAGFALAATPFSFIFGERAFLPMIGKAK